MRIRLLVIGRARDRVLAEAIAEYERRAARYWPLDVTELREGQGREADQVRAQEAERLLNAAAGALLVACDERGVALTSALFAQRLQGWREAARDVAIVIGGAFGLDPSVLDRADHKLQLAPWTLPHELARLVLGEQLYRAGTIVRREPYHK